MAESIQVAVVRAFEQALSLPDANIDRLIDAARRVARVIADGGASAPEAYAFAVLGRVAWRSHNEFASALETHFPSAVDSVVLSTIDGNSSNFVADVEIQRLLSILDARDQKIVVMRNRGYLYSEIAEELGLPTVTVRCR